MDLIYFATNFERVVSSYPMRKAFIVATFALCALAAGAFPAIPKESAKALGVTRGRPFSEGIVFVNGKYLPPPYVVERWGTGIRINKIPVTGQIISWNEFLKTQKNVKVVEPEPAADDHDAAEPAPPKEKPLKEKESEPAPPPPPAGDDAGESDGGSSSLDDLFSAAGAGDGVVVVLERGLAAPSDFGSVTEVNGRRVSKLSEARRWSQDDSEDESSGDDEPKDDEPKADESERGDDRDGDGGDAGNGDGGEDGGDSKPAPEPEPAAEPEPEQQAPAVEPEFKPAKPKRAASSKAKAKLVLNGPFVKNTASQMLVSKINAQRSEIDCALRSGGFICFGDGYARISGDRQSADHLLSVLPEIQMKSETLSEFCSAVRRSRLVYLHELVCRDLFANRIDYRTLQEHRAKIRKDREWKRLIDGGQSLF